MPCRREEEEEEAGEEAEGEEEEERGRFLLLERALARGGAGEVDRLVAQIGETLQLDAGQDRPASPCAPPGPPPPPPLQQPLRVPAAVLADKARPPDLPPPPLLLPPPPAPPAPASAAVNPAPPPGALRCALGDRGRVRGRAAPYFVAELAAGPSALSPPLSPQPSLDAPSRADKRGSPKPLWGPCRRGWLRGAAVSSRRLQQRRWPQPEARTGGDDDPHRLLQQLVLSGNLIKEAVRRLHSRRLQLHAKLPPRPLLRPPTAAALQPPSPRSPRAACSHPGAARGRGAPLGAGDGVLVPGS